MKTNIFKALMIAVCITGMSVNNVMAADNTNVTVEQHNPNGNNLKTTTVKLKATTQQQKSQIVKQLIAVKGIKNASFKGNTVYITYSPKRISAANAQAQAKAAYNKVVTKKHGNTVQQPKAGRYGSTSHQGNQPKPQGNQQSHQNSPKPDNNAPQPQAGRR